MRGTGKSAAAKRSAHFEFRRQVNLQQITHADVVFFEPPRSHFDGESGRTRRAVTGVASGHKRLLDTEDAALLIKERNGERDPGIPHPELQRFRLRHDEKHAVALWQTPTIGESAGPARAIGRHLEQERSLIDLDLDDGQPRIRTTTSDQHCR